MAGTQLCCAVDIYTRIFILFIYGGCFFTRVFFGCCMRRGMRPIYIYGLGIYFQPMRPGYAPKPKASKFQPILVGHTLRYALNLCARVCAQVCAAPEAPMGCLGQSSFESRYAPGIRQPHSSLVIWIQLEHGWIPPDSIWSKGMRQGYTLGTRTH